MFGPLRILATPRGLIGLTALGLALGLAQVWVTMERVDTAYVLREMRAERRELSEHVSKLQTEWNNRTSPHALAPLARKFGLVRAQPGQIRVLNLDAEHRNESVSGGAVQ